MYAAIQTLCAASGVCSEQKIAASNQNLAALRLSLLWLLLRWPSPPPPVLPMVGDTLLRHFVLPLWTSSRWNVQRTVEKETVVIWALTSASSCLHSKFNIYSMAFWLFQRVPRRKLDVTFINLLTPNVNYSGRTAPLTSKVAFYIFIQQI